MSYFHTGIRTIIGAEAFHGPVRDGKEWDHLAMVIRLDFFAVQPGGLQSQFTESCQLECLGHSVFDCVQPGINPCERRSFSFDESSKL